MPHIVGQIEDPMAQIASEIGIHERVSIEISNLSHWDAVINGMIDVVHGEHGTARRSGHGATFEFAGKTGTAQLFGIAQDETGFKYVTAIVDFPTIRICIIVTALNHPPKKIAYVPKPVVIKAFNPVHKS